MALARQPFQLYTGVSTFNNHTNVNMYVCGAHTQTVFHDLATKAIWSRLLLQCTCARPTRPTEYHLALLDISSLQLSCCTVTQHTKS